MTITLHHGDCFDILQTLEADSIDSVVTDPPYGLEFMGKKWDAPWKDGWQAGGGFSKPGIGERKTAWPSFSATSKFGAANPTCATCGGRARGAKRCNCESPVWKPIGQRKNPENEGLPDDMTGTGMANQMRGYQSWCERWAIEVFRVMKPGACILVFGGTRTSHRVACAIEDAGFEIRDTLMWVYGTGFPKSLNVAKSIDATVLHGRTRTEDIRKMEMGDAYTPSGRGRVNYDHGGGSVMNGAAGTYAPATDEAKAWDGWGTSLKPSYEPIILARKPLMGTVAQNVLKHGVGGLNIDACRIPIDPVVDDPRLGGKGEWSTESMAKNAYGDFAGTTTTSSTLGRFPANLIHDGSDEVLESFAQYGSRGAAAPVKGHEPSRTGQNGIYGHWGRVPGSYFNDSGTAARFFKTCPWSEDEEAANRLIYSSKASAKDRAGSHHPTVKPVSLMRYLCKLITPRRGTLLDLFAGSGTTGQAAIEEGIEHVILIEREAEYCSDIRQRLSLFMD